MLFKFKTDLYPKECLIKAAYSFTDIAYVHLDLSEGYYIVNVIPKEGKQVDEREFENELLAQVTRRIILQQTGDIRKLMLARAMASSVVENLTSISQEDDQNDTPEDASEILKDWFNE